MCSRTERKFLNRSRSSAGQSSGFLNRRSEVRVFPGPPNNKINYLADSLATVATVIGNRSSSGGVYAAASPILLPLLGHSAHCWTCCCAVPDANDPGCAINAAAHLILAIGFLQPVGLRIIRQCC